MAAPITGVRRPPAETVFSVQTLEATGCSQSRTRSQVRAGRWQRIGRAVILHNGPPTVDELRRAVLVILGPRAMLTSFTLLEQRGLQGWERDAMHVLVPRGARVCRPAELNLRVHYTDWWSRHTAPPEPVSRLAHAALLAAADHRRTRSACGLLAATVQQRLLRAADLSDALDRQPRLRHRHALVLAAADIAQGAHALSEIDFARLCTRYGLPAPTRQAVRVLANGSRRYLDAEWRSRTGRRIAVEVDGALHLVATRWWDDQLRQNELVIAGDAVIRFPSAVVRHESLLVVDQLRRALRT